MTKEQAKEYYGVLTDCWKLMYKWLMEGENTDSFFDKARAEADKFIADHQDKKRFAETLMMSCLEELGRALL